MGEQVPKLAGSPQAFVPGLTNQSLIIWQHTTSRSEHLCMAHGTAHNCRASPAQTISSTILPEAFLTEINCIYPLPRD
jgi:hypothetical protein